MSDLQSSMISVTSPSQALCLQLQSSTFASSSFGFLSNMWNMSNLRTQIPSNCPKFHVSWINLSWKLFKLLSWSPVCTMCTPCTDWACCEPVELDAHKAKSQKRISSSGRPPGNSVITVCHTVSAIYHIYFYNGTLYNINHNNINMCIIYCSKYVLCVMTMYS